MNVQELLLAIFSVVSSLVIVCFAIALGWYLVWILFLSRFKLVRELIIKTPEDSDNKKTIKTKKNRKE